jgi:phospholipase C
MSLLVVATLGLAVLTACGGVGVSPSNAATPPPTTTPPPPPPATPTDIKAVGHIVFMMQENRSFDSYFGKMSGVDGLPAGASNKTDDGQTIASFHFQSACSENADPDWLESHGDFNLSQPGSNTFVGNGYVHNGQGQAKFDGLVAEVTGGTGTFQAHPQHTTNYYLFSSQALSTENYSSLPLAVVTVTVTGDTLTQHPSAPAITPPAGVTFTANPTTVAPGQAVTLTWSVPGAGTTMVNTRFDQMGRRTMGFFDGNDLNYYYFMASSFATSDRWFSPIPSNSVPNRFYLYAATTHGHAHDPGTVDSGTVKNIFQLLDGAGITWKVYYTNDPALPGQPHTLLTRFQPFASQHSANLVPADQFATDLKNGTLAQVSLIEELPGFDEHPGATLAGDIHSGNNVQGGAQYVSTFINLFMQSQYWKDGVFFLTFDEAGGFFDHVAGQPAVHPDGLPPSDLRPADMADIQPPADFNRTGFRVPLLVVSPFTKKGFVSHQVADYTAILKFIETRFNLPNLTERDKAQPDISKEFFDFANPPSATPPVPPAQNLNMVCEYTKLGQ